MKFRSRQIASGTSTQRRLGRVGPTGRIGKVTALTAAFTLFSGMAAQAYTFRSTLNQGTVMEFYLNAGNGGNGTPLHLWPANGGYNQEFEPGAQQADGSATLINEAYPLPDIYPGLCMDITNNKLADRTQIQGWTCIDDPQQFWYVQGTGGQVPEPIYSDETLGGSSWCLDDYNGGLYNGAPIKLWECYGDRDQMWLY
jgi:hypothetical protein